MNLIQWISDLNVRRKFLLVGALGLAMVALPAWLVIEHEVSTLAVAKTEATGVVHAGRILELIQSTQQHRASTALWLGGDEAAGAARQSKQAEVDRALAEVSRLAGQAQARDIAALQTQWQSLKEVVSGRTIAGPQSFERHTALVATELRLLDEIVDTSGLGLDPDAGINYLVGAVLGQATAWSRPCNASAADRARSRRSSR